MATATGLRIVPLAAALALLIPAAPPARADQIVADNLMVQGNLCAGDCVDGEVFPTEPLKIKGDSPVIRFEDMDTGEVWTIAGTSGFYAIGNATPGNFPTAPVFIYSGAPDSALTIDGGGRVGLGTGTPAQPLHVKKDQNANTFFLVQNALNELNANAVVRTQADTAIQNFQSHASSRTLVRWGVGLGGWNEFLSVVGNGLAMGTLGNAPFILGTSATARMTFDGDSNIIDFRGGGQYNGNSFLDASSRALKQDIRPLGPDAALETLAGLEPVTFACTGAPGDPRVGFVAEDVPELVATPGRQTLSGLEIVAVLTKVVKEQRQAIQAQRVEYQRAIAELTARLAALEARP
jgi:hypothetical protein